MSDRDLVKAALIDAIGWQDSLADARAHLPDDPELKRARDQAERYRRLLKKRYGTKTPDEQLAATLTPVPFWPPLPGKDKP